MEDMFYFRSPTKPPLPKYRPDLRHKSKACKRRQSTKMGAQLQHACVVRLEEPVFCPSNIASIVSQHPSGLDALYGLVLNRSTLRNPITGVDEQEYTPQVIRGDSDGLPSDFSAQDDAARQEHTSPWRDTLSPHHPRPESLDIAQEEDGRRTRFALEDANEYAGLLQRLLHLDAPVDEGVTRTEDVDEDVSAHQEATHTQHGPLRPSTLTSLAMAFTQDIDDEALPVDDPRRSYDFKEFLQRTTSDESNCKHPSTLEESLWPSFPDALQDVTRSTMALEKTDIQGLRWGPSKMQREQVLQSRRLQHPSRRNILCCVDHKSVDEPISTSEVQYRYRAFSPKHRAHYSHYQLRNVLAATSRNDVFYAAGSKVMQTALSYPSMQNPIMDLTKTPISPSGFRTTCLSASSRHRDASYRADSVLLAGGFGGEYAMLDLNAERRTTPLQGFVTHEYNGLVTHIDSYADRHSGQIRACFCCNDRKVRILDINTNTFVKIRDYENALNCSALSPDGRLRAFVGDSNETLITDAEKGDILLTLEEHNDHGFACAWSEDGRSVATGAQDGVVVLWDPRNWSTPLRKFHCVTASARSLHFTGDGALVVGEDDDVVTVYDTKRPDVRQDIRFFGSIAGVALLDGGDELVVATSDRTVGGLMTFERTRQGLNGASFGERVCAGDGFRDSSVRNARHRPDVVAELFV